MSLNKQKPNVGHRRTPLSPALRLRKLLPVRQADSPQQRTCLCVNYGTTPGITAISPPMYEKCPISLGDA